MQMNFGIIWIRGIFLTHLVDLTKKPYNLSEEDVQWVEKTISQMSLDEKIGQLFCKYGF